MKLSLVRYLSSTFFTLFIFSVADAQSEGSITVGGSVNFSEIYVSGLNLDLMGTGVTAEASSYVNRHFKITGGGSFVLGSGEGLEISTQGAWLGLGLASNGINHQAGTGSNHRIGLSVGVSISDTEFLGSPITLDEVSVHQNLHLGTELSIAPGIFISADSSYGLPRLDYSYHGLGMGFKVGEVGMISFSGGISSAYDEFGAGYQYTFNSGYTLHF